jgi:hypothetical protein
VKQCIQRRQQKYFIPKSNSFLKISVFMQINTVAERVNNLAGIIQCHLKEKCKNCVAYSIAIDESTDVKDIAQLPAFVRGVT